MKKLLILLFISMSGFIYAQEDAANVSYDKYIELLRQDVKAERVAIVTEVMDFTDAEGSAFWPLFREYELEASKLGDERLSIIKDYAANYENLTDEKAKELMERVFKLEEKENKLRKKYFKKMDKVLSTKRVAKFFQIDNQINQLIDIQISSELPLIDEWK